LRVKDKINQNFLDTSDRQNVIHFSNINNYFSVCEEFSALKSLAKASFVKLV